MPRTNNNIETSGYYVFIANSVEWEPYTTGIQVVIALAKQNAWFASRFMPYRQDFKAGDNVLFYVAGKGERYFVGSAEIGGPIKEMTPEELQSAEMLGLKNFEASIPLASVNLWDVVLPIKPLVDTLSFIKDKKNYGLNLRRAASKIAAEDFAFVVGEAKKSSI